MLCNAGIWQDGQTFLCVFFGRNTYRIRYLYVAVCDEMVLAMNHPSSSRVVSECVCCDLPCSAFAAGRLKLTAVVVAPPAGDGSASSDTPHGEGVLSLGEHVAALERGDTISTKVAVNATNGSSGTCCKPSDLFFEILYRLIHVACVVCVCRGRSG